MQYNRPKVYGRVPKTWFTKESIAEDHMKGFSSDILGMIPLLCAFLVDLVEPMGILGEHIQCFKLLAYLIDILSLSCDVTPQIYNALRTTVDKHAKLFKKLIIGWLPPILLTVWQIVVMRVLYYIACAEGRSVSLSQIDRRIGSLYFYW